MIQRPAFYTEQEGGEWLPYPEGVDMPRVHSVKFADGREWDEINGWRKIRKQDA